MFCFHSKREKVSQEVVGKVSTPTGKTISKVITTYKCETCGKTFTRKGLK